MKVPFLNLKKQHEPLMPEIRAVFEKVVESSAFAGGPFVAAFEKDFAEFCGTKHAVGLGNGTDALWFALLGLGVGLGDEVITVPSTFIATAEAISYCGARPVFIDVDEETYTMDPALLEKAITPRTKAIIPVHLFGQTADMDAILKIAKAHNIPVIEDACQAHGATYKGRPAGSMGIAAAFSFYPGKNLGAMGEAGATVTNDTDLAAKMRMLRDHGQVKKYYHDAVGWNGRMDGLQGGILQIKLRTLAAGNELRRTHAAQYDEAFAGCDEIATPFAAEHNKHVYHVYAVRVRERDKILAMMSEAGIGCGIHYPVPLHLQTAYKDLGYSEGSFPVSERIAKEFLSLPMFPELTEEQIQLVAEELKTACGVPKPAQTAVGMG
jgi:dTDP-4-amino-4,6-dideoxygalactose transaminase